MTKERLYKTLIARKLITCRDIKDDYKLMIQYFTTSQLNGCLKTHLLDSWTYKAVAAEIAERKLLGKQKLKLQPRKKRESNIPST